MKRPARPRIVFRFARRKGAPGTVALDPEAVEAQLAHLYELMRHSSDPALRLIGEAWGKGQARAAVAGRLATMQRKKAAKRPRPTRRSPLRAAVVTLMHQARQAAPRLALKAFLRQWEREPIDGLALRLAGRKYSVGRDRERVAYLLSTLAVMWSEAGER